MEIFTARLAKYAIIETNTEDYRAWKNAEGGFFFEVWCVENTEWGYFDEYKLSDEDFAMLKDKAAELLG